MSSLKALFLIFAMLFAQTGLGRLGYVLPNGGTCVTCPTLADSLGTEDWAPGNLQIAAAHGDCHDCCTLAAKDSEGTGSLPGARDAGEHSVAILPETVLFGFAAHRLVFARVPVGVELYLPNGPPRRSPSRAPPASTIGL